MSIRVNLSMVNKAPNMPRLKKRVTKRKPQQSLLKPTLLAPSMVKKAHPRLLEKLKLKQKTLFRITRDSPAARHSGSNRDLRVFQTVEAALRKHKPKFQVLLDQKLKGLKSQIREIDVSLRSAARNHQKYGDCGFYAELFKANVEQLQKARAEFVREYHTLKLEMDRVPAFSFFGEEKGREEAEREAEREESQKRENWKGERESEKSTAYGSEELEGEWGEREEEGESECSFESESMSSGEMSEEESERGG
jgi:hypothetical protein